jgi:hypothetical protein
MFFLPGENHQRKHGGLVFLNTAIRFGKSGDLAGSSCRA